LTEESDEARAARPRPAFGPEFYNRRNARPAKKVSFYSIFTRFTRIYFRLSDNTRSLETNRAGLASKGFWSCAPAGVKLNGK
jgi:hypothetical protein